MLPRTSGAKAAGRSGLTLVLLVPVLVLTGVALWFASGPGHLVVAPRIVPPPPALGAGPPLRARPVRAFAIDPPAPAPLPSLPPPPGPSTPSAASARAAAGAAAFHGASPPTAGGRFHDLSDEGLGELARSVAEAEVRAELLRELGRRRAGLLTLLAFLDDASGPVRRAAADGLRRLGDPRAIDRLRDRAAREGDPSVRTGMAEALDGLARVAVSPH